MKKQKKKGQITMDQAPTVVLIIGLTFLIMATLALVGDKYGDSFTASQSVTVVNETVTQAELIANSYLDKAVPGVLCKPDSFAITTIYNATEGNTINSANYTFSSTGQLTNTTDEFSYENWLVGYTATYGGVACNVTADLNTEIGNNTSIAGIVLTISLVGVVLTLLISVFVALRRPRI